jgi:hypothetical protein
VLTVGGETWYRIRGIIAAASATNVYIYMSSNGTSVNYYTGDGSGFYIYAPPSTFLRTRGITRQRDRSMRASSRTQANTFSGPQLTTDPITDHDQVSVFSAVSRTLTSNAALAAVLAGTDIPWTWIGRIRFASIASGTVDAVKAAGSTAQQTIRRAAAKLEVYRKDDASGASTAAPAESYAVSQTTANFYVVCVSFTGTAVNVYVHDGSAFAASSGNPFTLDRGACTLTSLVEEFQNRAETESCWYTRALSQAECEAIANGMVARGA